MTVEHQPLLFTGKRVYYPLKLSLNCLSAQFR
jgi:hypothetical protein